MSSRIKILVADSNSLFRKSFSFLLNQQPDFKVCADVENGKQLIDNIKLNPYDIAILDTSLELIDGKAALEIMHIRFPKVKVIILSSKNEIGLMSEFMTHGASGFISKNCEVKTVYECIRTVHKEGYYFNKSVSEAMLFSLKNKSALVYKDENFTDRELTIIRKICEGMSNKDIAQNLNISLSTVDFHKAKIYNKLDCNSTAEILKYSLRKGIVDITSI